MMETLAAMGIVTVFAITAGFLAAGIVEMMVDAYEEEDNNKDYVYLNDGTPVEFNEEDQE